jgi:HlyD family secretion protein
MKSKLFFLSIASLLLFSCKSKDAGDRKTETSSAVPDSTLIMPAREINKVVGVGLIVPESLISDLSAQLSGTITTINKSIGDRVKANEIIIRLNDHDEQLALAKLLRQKETQAFQIKATEAELEDSKREFEFEKNNLMTAQELQKTGSETSENVDILSNKVNSLKLSVDQKRAELDVAQSQINAILVDIEQAKSNIEKKLVRAPADGQILQINATKYSLVNQNENLVTFAPDGPVIVRCEIDEMFANKTEIGQKAEIRYIGFSQVIGSGTVIKTSPYLSQKSLFVENPTDKQDRRVRDVRILVDKPKGLLFNSRVECTINLKTKS